MWGYHALSITGMRHNDVANNWGGMPTGENW